MRKKRPDAWTLEKVVSEMRRLGVHRWNGSPVGDVDLGEPPPPPRKELTREEIMERLARQEEQKQNVLFAHTSVRPVIKKAGA